MADLWSSTQQDRVSAVKRGLEFRKGVDVNYPGDALGNRTLHLACKNGNSQIVKLLLAHPLILPNAVNRLNQTPLHVACHYGQAEIVRLLLSDSTVEANLLDTSGKPPLAIAIEYDYVEIAKLMIAMRQRVSPWTSYAWDEGPRRRGAAALVGAYFEDLVLVRNEVRRSLGLTVSLVAELFAMVVFYSDGLLKLRMAGAPLAENSYFRITKRLPLELQKVLCNVTYASSALGVKREHSETAFRKLARMLFVK